MIYEDVDINGYKLKNSNSVNAQDAATKQYVYNLKGPAFNAENTIPQNLRANEKQKIHLMLNYLIQMKNLVYRLADFNREKQDITKSMQTSYLIMSTKTITAMYTCTRTIIPFCKLVVEIITALLSFAFLATLWFDYPAMII